MTKRKKPTYLSWKILAVLLALLFFSFLLGNSGKHADRKLLSQKEYDSVFVSMYPISAFHEEDFLTYRGLHTVIASHTQESLSDVSDYLEQAFSGNNQIVNVSLGIDPLTMWKNARQKEENLQKALQKELFPYVVQNPAVNFEVLLSFPSLDYQKTLSSSELTGTITALKIFFEQALSYPNLKIYGVGTQEWLVSNPDNYTDNFTVHPDIAQKIMLLTFCDDFYKLTPEDFDSYLENLETIPQKQKEYPDFHQQTLVFFGDSIFGNYSGSTSIPGVVSALSDAKVYNCARGGATAAEYHDATATFPLMAEAFVNQDTSYLSEDAFSEELSRFRKDHPSKKKLCFVINYGLNDYFSGLTPNGESLTAYEGGLRDGIHQLKEAYPKAKMLLVGPSFCSTFSNGTEILSENGGSLVDYVETAKRIASEWDIPFANPYEDLGVNEDNSLLYLSDETHFNEAGRFLMGEFLIRSLQENLFSH